MNQTASKHADIMSLAKRIGEYIIETGDEDINGFKILSRSHFRSGPNPFYCHTNDGLYLVVGDSGIPNILHTPLGKWTLFGSTFTQVGYNSENFVNFLKTPLGLTLEESKSGQYRKVWKIGRFEGQELPEPSYRDEKDERGEWESQCREEWKEIATNLRWG